MPRSKKISWRVGLVLLPVLVVITLLVPAVRAAREAAARHMRVEQIRWVFLALNNYSDTFQRLPDAAAINERGEPLYSWRFQVMPFREGLGAQPDFESAWTASSNKYFANLKDYIYCSSRKKPKPDSFECYIAAIIGPGTPLQKTGSMRLADVPCDTILIVEVKHASDHWMAPGDLALDKVDRSIVEGTDGRGLFVGFADGEAWMLDRTVPFDKLKLFFTASSDTPRNRESDLGPYRHDSADQYRHGECK